MAIKWGTPPLQMLAFRCLADHRKPLFIHKKTKTNHVHNLCYLYMSPPQKKKKNYKCTKNYNFVVSIINDNHKEQDKQNN